MSWDFFIQQFYFLCFVFLMCSFYFVCTVSSPLCAVYLSPFCPPACFYCLNETDSSVVWPPQETHRPQDSQQSAERQCHILDLILAAIPVSLYFDTDGLYRSRPDVLHNSATQPLDQPSLQKHTYTHTANGSGYEPGTCDGQCRFV